MALRIRRGTDAERQTITPGNGELIYTTDTKALYVGDGSTQGGKLLASGGTIISDLVLNSNDITGTGNIDITGNIDVTGNIHATGSITADGNLTLGDAGTDSITVDAEFTSHLIPDENGATGNVTQYNLGSATQQWNVAYINSVLASSVTADNLVGTLDGDIKGSVFGEDSTPLVDAIASRIVGPIETSENAVFTGNVDLTGATVTGDLTGDLTGNVTGTLTGDVTGDLTGDLYDRDGVKVIEINSPSAGGATAFVGAFAGDLRGSIFGDDSKILIDQTESAINLEGTVKGIIEPDTDGTHDIGSSLAGFGDIHTRGKIYIGQYDFVNLRTELIGGTGLLRLSVKGGAVARPAVTTTLNGNVQTGVSRTTVAVASDTNIQAGAIFRLPGTGELVVDSVNSNVVTTTESWTASGGLDGDSVSFYNPPRPNTIYTDSAPATGVGRPGDTAGLIFADANYIYVCRDDYDGVTEIWTRSAHVAW